MFTNGRLLKYTYCEKWHSMPLIGYARVSTDDQTLLPQAQALRAAGCAVVLEEQALDGDHTCPVLARFQMKI